MNPLTGHPAIPDEEESESDDLQYEPATEESQEEDEDEDEQGSELDQEAFIERLLAAQEEENEDQDGGNSRPLSSFREYLLILSDGGQQFNEIEVQIQEDNDNAEPDQERSEPPFLFTFMHTVLLILQFAVARQRRQVILLLQHTAIGRLFQFSAEDDDDDDDDEDRLDRAWRPRRRRRTRPDPDRFPKVPSDVGIDLMNSGTFGVNDVLSNNASLDDGLRKRKRLARRILDRELAVDSEYGQKVNRKIMAQVYGSATLIRELLADSA